MKLVQKLRDLNKNTYLIYSLLISKVCFQTQKLPVLFMVEKKRGELRVLYSIGRTTGAGSMRERPILRDSRVNCVNLKFQHILRLLLLLRKAEQSLGSHWFQRVLLC